MKVPHNIIAWQPKILLCRINRLKQRHMFLESRGAAQYDPNLPNYVSLDALIEGTDGEFAVNVAKSSLHAFSDFLKTL
jgi:mTERF domain-containing protein